MTEWNPESVRQAIDLEMHGEAGKKAPTYETLAEEIIIESLPMAAHVMRHLAEFSQNENMQYKAASYILDQGLGRSTDEGKGKKDALTSLEKLVNTAVRDN